MVVRCPLVLAALRRFSLGLLGLGLLGCGPRPAAAPPIARSASPVAEPAAPSSLVHDVPVDAPTIEASETRGPAGSDEPNSERSTDSPAGPSAGSSVDAAIDEPDERPDAPVGSRDPFNSDVVDDNREGKHIIERALRPPAVDPAAATP